MLIYVHLSMTNRPDARPLIFSLPAWTAGIEKCFRFRTIRDHFSDVTPAFQLIGQWSKHCALAASHNSTFSDEMFTYGSMKLIMSSAFDASVGDKLLALDSAVPVPSNTDTINAESHLGRRTAAMRTITCIYHRTRMYCRETYVVFYLQRKRWETFPVCISRPSRL